MAIQRSILALVQAVSDIDQAPCTGRAAEKSGTAADPYQRRSGSEPPLSLDALHPDPASG
jgi:hypothetical protein